MSKKTTPARGGGVSLFSLFAPTLLSCLFVLLPVVLSAQTKCAEPVTPQFPPIEAIPNPPLCIEFQNFVPDDGFTFTGTTNSSSLSNLDFTDKNVTIEGSFIVDIGSLAMTRCTLKMAPEAVIIVNPNAEFFVDHSIFFSCEKMWKGIQVQNSGHLYFTSNRVEDAEFALTLPYSCSNLILNNYFNRNHIGISSSLYDPSGLNCVTTFTGNTFDCNAPLAPGYDGQPDPGLLSFAGLVALSGDMLDVVDCRFLRQQFGIFTLLASGNIRNCSFSDLPYVGDWSGLETGTGILAAWNSDLIISGQGGEESSPVMFDNCATSCVSAYGSNIILANTRTTNIGDHGVITKSMADHRALVYGNRFEAGPSTYPIYVLYMERSANQSDQVYLNHIVSEITAGGIAAYNHFNVGAKKCIIRNNDLKLNGEYSIGMDIGHHRNLDLSDNLVQIFRPSPFAVRINLSDGENDEHPTVRVEDLTVEATGSGTGLECQTSKRVIFCYNHLIEGSRGMRVRGSSDNSKLFFTEFKDNDLGLLFDAATVTEVQDHRGNYWVGYAENQIGARHNGSNYNDSQFFVNGSQPPPDPNGTYMPNRVPNNWFTNLGGDPNPCTPPPPPLYTQHDLDVADGTYAGLIQDDLAIWEAECELYRKIMETPGMIGADPAFATFQQTKSVEAIGVLYDVDKKIETIIVPSVTIIDQLEQDYKDFDDARVALAATIDQLAADPGNPTLLDQQQDELDVAKQKREDALFLLDQLSETRKTLIPEAISLNTSVPDMNLFETNAKTVNDILLHTLGTADFTYKADQLNQLNAVASQCPTTGGPAVYRALYMLPACVQRSLLEDHATCTENRESIRPAQQQLTRIQCLATPNMPGDFVQFSTSNLDQNMNPQLMLTDLSGHILYRGAFTAPVQRIPTTGFAPGIYFYRLEVAGLASVSGKVVISR